MKLFLLFFIICIAAALQQEDGKKGLSKGRKSFSVGNLRKPIKAGKKVPKNNRKKKRKNNIAAKKRTARNRKTGRKQGKKTKATLSGRQQNSTTWETCFENSVTALRRYKGLFTY